MQNFKQSQIEKRVDTLIEYRNVFQSDFSELNVFETYKKTESFDLSFDYPVIVSMIKGKKVMHLQENNSFIFSPGETLILPSNEPMQIDFPEATFSTPTHCLALGVEPSIIKETISQFQEELQFEHDLRIQLNTNEAPGFVHKKQDIHLLIEKITRTFINKNVSRDVLLKLMIKELIVRLMQTKARNSLLTASSDVQNNNRIAYIVTYIKKNLQEKLTVEDLSKKAYMSPSHFHRLFKEYMGESPISFILKERIDSAVKLMRTTHFSITEISALVGFSSPAYFTRQFKRMLNVSPQKFRRNCSQLIVN